MDAIQVLSFLLGQMQVRREIIPDQKGLNLVTLQIAPHLLLMSLEEILLVWVFGLKENKIQTLLGTFKEHWS